MTSVHELTLKLLDDTLSDEEFDELQWMLAESSALRAEHVALMELEGALRGTRQVDLSRFVMAQIERLTDDGMQKRVMARIQVQRPPWKEPVAQNIKPIGTHASVRPIRASARPSRRLRRKHSVAVIWHAAAAMLALAVLIFLGLQFSSSSAVALGELELAESTNIVRSGTQLKAAEKTAVFGADTLNVGSGGAAILALQDGTRVLLDPDTTVRLEPQQLTLLAGSMHAKVHAQAARTPFRVVTEHATSTVLGTRFTVAFQHAQTRLEVNEGRVQFERSGDKASVIVAAGQYAIAAPGVAMAVHSLNPTPAPAKQPTAAARPPAAAATTSFGVVGFTLVNADNGHPVPGYINLSGGDLELDLNRLPRNISLYATTVPEVVGSVVFDLNGKKAVRVENSPIYAMSANWDGNRYVPWVLSPGTHTLTATPYRGKGGSGVPGDSLSITLHVIVRR